MLKPVQTIDVDYKQFKMRNRDTAILMRVVQGGYLARITNLKNRGSRFTDMNISFPESRKSESELLFLMIYSYKLQVTYLSHSPDRSF